MNKKLLLSSTCLVMFSPLAFAADLPSRSVAPTFVAPVPIFSWTGLYAGVTAGVAVSNDKSSLSASGSCPSSYQAVLLGQRRCRAES